MKAQVVHLPENISIREVHVARVAATAAGSHRSGLAVPRLRAAAMISAHSYEAASQSMGQPR